MIQGFPIALRDGRDPSVGGMENFAGFFFIIIIECYESEEDRNEFDHFYFFKKLKTTFWVDIEH